MLLNCFLLIPIFGGIISDEFQWTFIDYVLALILLNVLGLSFVIIRRYVKLSLHMYIFFSIALVLFFLIWAELAVGIFDSIFAGS
jgi:hypothetical protein